MKSTASGAALRGFTCLALLLSLATPACTRKKNFPDSAPGWHSPNYQKLFGRLQRIPAKNPDDPPQWVIRYGYTNADTYSGIFNLTPPQKLTGYVGGEQVEITGAIRPDLTNPDMPGAFYEIHGIRLWSGSKNQ